MQLKMQAKQFENEAKRCQKEAAKERAKAKAALKKGNKAAAQLYAQNAIRFETQAQQLLQSCAATNGYATDIRMGTQSLQMSKNMNLATSQLDKTVHELNVEKIASQRTKLDSLKTKMGATHELLVGGEGELEVAVGAEDLLSALELECAEDAMLQMEEIPQGFPPTPSNPIPGKSIKN